MSKPDIAAVVDLSIDFIVQNVSTATMQCHFTDGWGASTTDPAGQEDCRIAAGLHAGPIPALRPEEHAELVRLQAAYSETKW